MTIFDSIRYSSRAIGNEWDSYPKDIKDKWEDIINYYRGISNTEYNDYNDFAEKCYISLNEYILNRDIVDL